MLQKSNYTQLRSKSQVLSVSLLQEHPIATSLNSMSHSLWHHLKYPAQQSSLSGKGTGLENPQKTFNIMSG